MPLPDVAIFHDSQSRNAAPPQWSALRTRGCSRTRLPSPSGTTNSKTPRPVVTPSRQGRPLRTPACAPAAVSMMLLGPGVTAATTAKRRNATICSVVVRYPRAMRLKETRSAGEGLERSCQGTVAGWLVSSRPAGGVELLSAWFAGKAYQRHRHDTYAIGVTDSGVQVFDYRGSVHASAPGQVVVLYPDEAHDGRAGTDDGFGYRILYVQPALLADAVRAIRGRPYPLPFVNEPVSTNATLSRAIEGAFRAPLELLAIDSLVIDLARGLMAGERNGASPLFSRRVDVPAVERARQFLDAE